MKFQFLGTAAAEGIPGLFCNCPTCQRTRAAGGKNFRSRAQAIINEDLLLDFGPDTYMHVCRFGLVLSKIRHLLITHAHDDHLTPSELAYRINGYAYLTGDKENDDSDFPQLEMYISEQSLSFVPENLQKIEPLRIHVVKAFEPFSAGNYTVTPYTAKHAPGYGALFYSISDGEKTVLYAHDTGLFPADTVAYLKQTEQRFDMVSLDCTGMKNPCGDHHMGIENAAKMKALLTEIGCAGENTRWFVNHFSHNGECTHDEFVPLAAEYGFEVSYDGLTLEI